ncbi:MAG: helix-turn-helix transcriptional regulator [Clostridiales bacterium]|nr:helix-turn-helix transcriptional regulator [Clostridiales bacterium]
MSKFSFYLKELLEQQGEPITKVAKNARVDRTSIHKALNDKRILSYTALRRLTQYLQLTLPQIRELNRYYEMLLQGEDIFYIQEEIRALLSRLPQMTFAVQTSSFAPAVNVAAPSALVYGHSQVDAIIRTILYSETAREDAAIYLSLPPGMAAPNELQQLWGSGRRFTACQLAAFLPNHAGKSTALANLRLLQMVIPMALKSRGQYNAYYYFANHKDLASPDPLPYFILTPNYLIRSDEKGSAAHIVTDPELIALYRNHFSQLMRECQPLTSYANDVGSVLEAYMDNTSDTGYYTMMTQPCFGRYYTRELIEHCYRPGIPERDTLVEISDRRFARLRSLNKNYYTIFTETGLRQFAADGVAADLPPELVLPGTVSIRLELLRQLRQDIAAGVVVGCIADTSRLDIPNYLTLTADPQFGLHLYAIQGFPNGSYTCNLHIQEASIGQSFCNFIKSLPDSEWIYPKERTLSILDELIVQLQTSLTEREEEPV